MARSLLNRLRAVYHPARVQTDMGHGSFEGWYFKLVGPEGEPGPMAVIPGISRERDGSAHCFVQLIRSGGDVRYVRYPATEFRFAEDRFLINVGPNVFGRTGMELDAPSIGLRGRVSFGNWHEWPVTLRQPGIMGWYRYVPSMECYHAVLSMDHSLTGFIELDGTRLPFDGGRGYIEKDWGNSFPSSWIWAQSNHFERADVSLTLSVAMIPWRGTAFVGHIAGVMMDGHLHRFATYTGARLLEVECEEQRAHVVIEDARRRLEVMITGAATGSLKAPVAGAMEGRADETLGGTVELTLTGRGGARMFQGVGRHAGVEIMDSRGELAVRPPSGRGGRGPLPGSKPLVGS